MTPDQLKGQAGVCETVKIVTDDGYVLINKADFDDKLHTLYEASEDPAADEAVRQAAKDALSPGQKVGRKK